MQFMRIIAILYFKDSAVLAGNIWQIQLVCNLDKPSTTQYTIKRRSLLERLIFDSEIIQNIQLKYSAC